jgi:hypothetical protein
MNNDWSASDGGDSADRLAESRETIAGQRRGISSLYIDVSFNILLFSRPPLQPPSSASSFGFYFC